MAAVFRHNFRADMSAHESVQRTYALNDEAGLILCTWPRGGRERFPFPYCDEVWTGFEYQVAAHLMYEGLIDEGLAIVKGARARHDGVARNPWNEFECGDHYARAMSSWSLVLALSGQRYDGRSGGLTMRPLLNREDFRCVYTAADAYGVFSQRLGRSGLAVAVDCRAGQVLLKEICLRWPGRATPKSVEASLKLSGQGIPGACVIRDGQVEVKPARELMLRGGDRLEIVLRPAGKLL
jgi:hypothetical protein